MQRAVLCVCCAMLCVQVPAEARQRQPGAWRHCRDVPVGAGQGGDQGVLAVVVVCWWWWLVVFLLGCGSCFPAGAQQSTDTDMHVAERRVRLLQSCAQAVIPMLLLPACRPCGADLGPQGLCAHCCGVGHANRAGVALWQQQAVQVSAGTRWAGWLRCAAAGWQLSGSSRRDSLCMMCSATRVCFLTCPCAAACVPPLCCSWVAPRWLEFVSRRLRVAVGYPMGRWRTLMPCK